MPKVSQSEKSLLKDLHQSIVSGDFSQVTRLAKRVKNRDREYWSVDSALCIECSSIQV